MKRLIFILFFLFSSVSACWALDQPLIDQDMKVIEEKIEVEAAECLKNSKIPNKASAAMKCRKRVSKSYRLKGKMRGTEEYCEFQYKKADFKELEALKKKLIIHQRTARNSYDVMYDEDRQPGEVTKEDLQTEIQWIESRLAKMQRAKTEKDARSIGLGKRKGRGE